MNKKQNECANALQNFTFTENDFIMLLLPYLYREGIREITECELAKKLYPYYQDNRFEEVFVDIIEDDNNKNRVNITRGMAFTQYFSAAIRCNLNHPENLRLAYGNNYDTSVFEKSVDPKIIKLINVIASEFGIRNSIESRNQNVYGSNPNQCYTTLTAKEHGEYGIELITDGDIQSITSNSFEPHVVYPDPIGSMERSFKNGTCSNVCIKNASYAITRGTHDGKIKRTGIFTKSIELEKLKMLSNVAQGLYDSEATILTPEKPYVRKLTLN